MEKKPYEDIEGKVEALLEEIDVKNENNNVLVMGKYGNTPFLQAKGNLTSLSATLITVMAANPVIAKTVLIAVNTFLDHKIELERKLKDCATCQTTIKEI